MCIVDHENVIFLVQYSEKFNVEVRKFNCYRFNFYRLYIYIKLFSFQYNFYNYRKEYSCILFYRCALSHTFIDVPTHHKQDWEIKKKIIKRIHHQELYRRIKKNHIHPQNSTIIHGILILSHCNPRQSKDF